MKLHAGMAIVALAALTARAEEPAAPLENSRQELKSLQKGAAPGADGSAGKMRDIMPQIQSPVAETLPFDLPKSEKPDADQKKKKDSQKNWLLDGMDKLDKNTKGKDADSKNAPVITSEEDKDKPVPGDPDYLLSLYSDQQKSDTAKADAKQPPKRAHNDPMTPFLQGWLADSPVRGKFFDDYIKKPDSGGAGGVSPASVQQDASPGLSLAPVDLGGAHSRNTAGTPEPVRVNPYLQGLDMSGLQELGGGSRQSSANSVPQAGPVQPAPALADPVPLAPAPEKKAPLSTQADDKKYFPQLNKF